MQKRKVSFKVYQPNPAYITKATTPNEPANIWVEKTGLWQGWGVVSSETENGIGNDTVGIIEMPDGTMEGPFFTHVTFLPEEVEEKEVD